MCCKFWCCCCGGDGEQANLTKVERVGYVAPVVVTQPATAGSRHSFEQECLAEHNRLRALHGCPPLTLSRELCGYAAQWAKRLANENTIRHRPEAKYGENIFWASGYDVDGVLPVKDWYDEMPKYDFGKATFKKGTGHFTQIIWKASRELGVAMEKRQNEVWVVANYNPPGNVMGEFKDNVPRRIR